MRILRVWLALSLLAGCASTARVTGDFGEYRSYREFRLATTLEARLRASDRYLRQFPEGDYRQEVRSWFTPAEKRYFKLSWNNLPRLRAYLDALPRGPHAAAASERITELESRRVFADRREQRAAARAQGFESRLAEAAEQRRVFLREFTKLTRLLAGVHSFGQPSATLDSELSLRLGLAQAQGRCDADHCRNVFSLGYAVPEDKQMVERNVELTLEFTLERGLVSRLSLSAPELLTRVAEAAALRAIPNHPQARAEALGQALDLVATALDSLLPEPRCAAEAVSPVVFARHCDGRRVEIIAGTEAGALDRVVVLPERR